MSSVRHEGRTRVFIGKPTFALSRQSSVLSEGVFIHVYNVNGRICNENNLREAITSKDNIHLAISACTEKLFHIIGV